MKTALFPVLFLLTGPLFSLDVDPFIVKLQADGIRFSRPEGLHSVPKVETQVPYDVGFRTEDDTYELRIAIETLPEVADLEALADHDQIYAQMVAMTRAAAAAIAGKDTVPDDTKPFRDSDLRRQYGADYGTFMEVSGGSPFAGSFQFVAVSAFYRKGRGYFVLYHLFKDRHTYDALRHMRALGAYASSMKFR